MKNGKVESGDKVTCFRVISVAAYFDDALSPRLGAFYDHTVHTLPFQESDEAYVWSLSAIKFSHLQSA